MTGKSLLRWAGSKRKILPFLKLKYSQNFNTYIEPFAGSACLFFEINPRTAILGDINKNLVEMYNTLKENPSGIYLELQKYEITKEFYYNIRSLDVDSMDSIKRAARFIYLNRYCFNGLYRTNKSGKFNVPYAPTKTGKLPSINELVYYSDKLKNAEIYSVDFEEVICMASSGDFVYLDPPYAQKNKKITNQYGPDNFGVNDIARLTKILRKLDGNNIYFVLSYAKCDEIIDLSNEWSNETIKVQRNIAGFSKFRKIADEVIITNIKVVYSDA